MVEKKIYSSWAFQDNAYEKRKMNMAILKELEEKYKIATNTYTYNTELRKFEDIKQDDYDVIIKCDGKGYGHTDYQIIKNTPNLSKDELALICDGGNLCFGYRSGNKTITIYTD